MLDLNMAPLDVSGGFPPPAVRDDSEKMISRERPEPPKARLDLVKQIQADIRVDKMKWADAFKRMKEDMAFARRGASKSWSKTRYVANLVQRHIAQRVAAVYAKNPTIVVRRRETLDFAVWDEKPESLQQALMSMQAGIMDPSAFELLQDFQQGMARRKAMDALSRTLQIVLRQQIARQPTPFKRRMKQVVRRALTVGVSYIKVTFIREMTISPETAARVNEMQQRLARIKTMMADLADGESEKDSAEAEELRIDLEALQSTPDMIQHEGIVIEYPRSTSIIPDRKCHDLQNFLGCDHVTEEFLLSVDEVKDVFGVDVGKKYKAMTVDPKTDEPAIGDENSGSGEKKRAMVRVWGTWSRTSGVIYWTADGYPDFLQEPAPPDVVTERFWPWFPVMFNEVEDEEDIFPPSDTSLLRSPQEEHNRSREGLRQHRRANLPKYAARRGSLTEEDRGKLRNAAPHEVLELDGLGPTQKVDDLLQTIKGAPIDPSTYDVKPFFEDTLRTVGSQEANLGGTSGATATESSIAESSRMSAQSSNVDDTDDTLTEVSNMMAQIALREMSFETVKGIAGPGAVWPSLDATTIFDELYAEIQAGSSGRPNKVQEIQNFQRIAPILMQIPGIKPEALAREGIMRMDDRMDLTDMMMSGLPSIQMMNSAKPATGEGGADNDPNQDTAQNRPAAPPNDPGLSPGGEVNNAAGGMGGGQVIHFDSQGNQIQ